MGRKKIIQRLRKIEDIRGLMNLLLPDLYLQNYLNNGNYCRSPDSVESAGIRTLTKASRDGQPNPILRYSQEFLNKLIFKICRKRYTTIGWCPSYPLMKFLVVQKEAFISPSLIRRLIRRHKAMSSFQGSCFPTCWHQGPMWAEAPGPGPLTE